MSRPSSASPLRRAFSFLTLAIFFSLLSLDLPAAVLEKEAQPALDPPNLPLTQPPFVQVRDRISSFIDDVSGHAARQRPSSRPGSCDAGAVATDFPMDLLLTLLPDSTQQDVSTS